MMSPNIFCSKKFSLTVITWKFLICFIFYCTATRVNFEMMNNFLTSTKNVITDLALKITFLCRVQSCMLTITKLRCIRFPTVRPITCVHFLDRIMYTNMVTQMIFSIKSLTANITSKGSSFTVYKTMTYKFKFRIESLIT